VVATICTRRDPSRSSSQSGSGLDHVLAVVEHEQHLLVMTAAISWERIVRSNLELQAEACRHDQARVGNRRQINEPDSVL